METVAGTTEIVVRGRNVVVPDHFRQHVAEKLAKLERYDDKIHRIDVELQHEKNPRQNESCQHVEITCRTRGPVVRARGVPRTSTWPSTRRWTGSSAGCARPPTGAVSTTAGAPRRRSPRRRPPWSTPRSRPRPRSRSTRRASR